MSADDRLSADAQVLLVRLGVGGVFVEHERVARLDLGLEDGVPQLLRLDGPLGPTLLLVLVEEGVKLGAVAVGQTGRLGGAEERPVAVGLRPGQLALSAPPDAPRPDA